MKKMLKAVGIILLFIIALIIMLFIMVLNKKAVPKDYMEKVTTGGDIETKYIKNGTYEVSYIEMGAMQNFKKYEIYYPLNIENENKKYPAVIFSNGTGVKGSSYPALLEHLSSWGFIVIATEEEYSWNGLSSNLCLKTLQKINNNKDIDGWEVNPFYNKVDFNNIGVSGHSQGGAGVINAITNTTYSNMYKTAFIESPTNKELEEALDWNYDARKINIPVLLTSSTGDADINLVVNLEQLKSIYDDIPETVNKVMLRRNNADHGDMLYFVDGYMTAWFMWQLQNDEEAAKAFVGDNAEILNNTLYQDIDKNI